MERTRKRNRPSEVSVKLMSYKYNFVQRIENIHQVEVIYRQNHANSLTCLTQSSHHKSCPNTKVETHAQFKKLDLFSLHHENDILIHFRIKKSYEEFKKYPISFMKTWKILACHVHTCTRMLHGKHLAQGPLVTLHSGPLTTQTWVPIQTSQTDIELGLGILDVSAHYMCIKTNYNIVNELNAVTSKAVLTLYLT